MTTYADLVLTNGKIYTMDGSMGEAETAVIKDGRFLYIGRADDPAYKDFVCKNTRVVDLSGKTVIPGIIDSHIHPVSIAKSSWHVLLPRFEDNEREALLEYVKQYCQDHSPKEVPYFFGESYPTTMFGECGPRKELLDQYVSDRPVRLQDFSDHGCWMNSVALKQLGIEKGKPDPKGMAIFVRDHDGEPTGWVREPGVENFEMPIFEKIGWYPPSQPTEEILSPYLDYLTSKGIIAIFDGITEGEETMKLFYDMDMAGKLHMFYRGSVLLENACNIEKCVDTVKKWQRNYTSRHVGVHTIKFFLDGTNEMGTSAVLEPFQCDPGNYGNMNMTQEQLTETMLRLNEEKLDLHLHIVGDRAFQAACNAVEAAKNQCKEEWMIQIQFAHCELVDPADMKRPAELGISINWSPHWGGGFFGEAAIKWLGKERFNRMYDFTKMIAAGTEIAYSSDVMAPSEANRADPFIGIECSHTRIDVEEPLESGVRKPGSAKLSVEELVRGYTMGGAKALRLDSRIGSIEIGKLANLVVLNQDPFQAAGHSIHNTAPELVLFEGNPVFGKLFLDLGV